MNAQRANEIAQQVTDSVLRQLPETLQREVSVCRIEFAIVEECLSEEPDLDEDLLGLFEGNSRLDPPPEHPLELPRIRLFLDNLWDHSDGDLQGIRHPRYLPNRN